MSFKGQTNSLGTNFGHKTFRVRRGRILNILCTFNLSPVSTGNAKKSEIQ